MTLKMHLYHYIHNITQLYNDNYIYIYIYNCTVYNETHWNWFKINSNWRIFLCQESPIGQERTRGGMHLQFLFQHLRVRWCAKSPVCSWTCQTEGGAMLWAWRPQFPRFRMKCMLYYVISAGCLPMGLCFCIMAHIILHLTSPFFLTPQIIQIPRIHPHLSHLGLSSTPGGEFQGHASGAGCPSLRHLQRLASSAPGWRALHGGAEEPAAEVVSAPGAELGRRAKEAGGGMVALRGRTMACQRLQAWNRYA